MKTFFRYYGLMMAICLSLTACEKPVIDIDDPHPDRSGDIDVRFTVTHFEQIPFADAVSMSRASVPASQVCSRINLAVFNGDTKVKAVNQTIDDEGFGTPTVSLAAGSYRVVILAHSCAGNATISSPEEIKFPNNKVTDTFLYCGDLTVSEAKNIDIQLKRVVAKFLLVTEDYVPENVTEMTFKYTGGSSTLNAVTGFGSVNSRQTEVREVTSSMHGKPAEFEVYTFPHAETGSLKVTVTATDAASETVTERIFEEVPVRVNQITKYTGSFFTGSGESSSSAFALTADNDWTETGYSY